MYRGKSWLALEKPWPTDGRLRQSPLQLARTFPSIVALGCQPYKNLNGPPAFQPTNRVAEKDTQTNEQNQTNTCSQAHTLEHVFVTQMLLFILSFYCAITLSTAPGQDTSHQAPFLIRLKRNAKNISASKCPPPKRDFDCLLKDKILGSKECDSFDMFVCETRQGRKNELALPHLRAKTAYFKSQSFQNRFKMNIVPFYHSFIFHCLNPKNKKNITRIAKAALHKI